MEELDYWRLCETFTLPQAAALIVGESPLYVIQDSRSADLVINGIESALNPRFQAVLNALCGAYRRGSLPGDTLVGGDNAIDLRCAWVATEDICAWLSSKGITTGFFFPSREEGMPGYLDKSHPNYAPKLAAAIRAWEAVTSDPERLRGKTPKQAITKWLNEHAAAYGLTKEDGTPNATGVEEAAKLANWKPEGGASKTPGE